MTREELLAFPSGIVRKRRPMHDPGGDFVVTDLAHPANSGMTLRDYFAAKAMQGLLGDPNIQATKLEFATEAYAMADAMLRAREAK